MGFPGGEQVEAVRAFNRDYTRAAGLITERMHDTPHSLTEARVIWEIGAGPELAQADLPRLLGLDAGYLSRVVSRLGRRGLLSRRRSPDDGRSVLLALTAQGREHRTMLDERAASRAGELLAPIPPDRRRELVGAMGRVREILEPSEERPRIVLRSPGHGDLGWIVQRHGELYWREYGWGSAFETLVAGVAAEFGAGLADSPACFAGWIAELGGERAGSVLCMRDDDETARLRLLLVEPFARGHGIGGLLVDECIRFARRAGYRDLVLWTNSPLAHARPIYERAGFVLDREFTHARFGIEMTGQDMRLQL